MRREGRRGRQRVRGGLLAIFFMRFVSILIFCLFSWCVCSCRFCLLISCYDFCDVVFVGVPFNTAVLGFHNMDGDGVFANLSPGQMGVLDAIKSSFSMMESVLNDVLDFQKMEEGNSSPFPRVPLLRPSLNHHLTHKSILLRQIRTPSPAF